MTRHDLGTVLVAGAALFTLALGARVAGHQQPGQDVRGSQTATVDFVVVARDGQPVADLKADEITLKIDGKVRPIRSLQFVRVSGGSGAPAANPSAEVAPAFATNIAVVAAVARSFVIVVDDESMPLGQEPKLHAALTTFVRGLPPTDQVALVTVPHGGIKVAFTTDRDRLAKAIAEIMPISPMDAPPCRTLTTLSTLESTLNQLVRNSGEQPVTVAFLSTALTGTSTVEAMQRANISGAGGVSAQAGGCYMKADDFVRVGQAVAAARAQLYIIHPDYSTDPAQEGVENLRGQTNAPLFHLVSNTEPGLARMARETAGYYVATFDTDPDELTGKPHQSSVRTTRKDVDVRDRPYLVVGRAVPSASSTASTTSTTTVTTAFDMLRSGKQFRDLPLRATTSSSRNPPLVDATTGVAKLSGAVDVIGLFEPIDPSVTIMTAAAALIDDNGKAMAYWDSDPKKPMTTWPVAIGLTVAPGKYRLRIAAIDSNGRTGLIDDTLVAELRAAGPLQIGGLVLGLSRAGGFSPRIQFSTEASAIAYMELYGGKEGTQLSVVFEVARTTDGPAMLSVIGTLAATNEDGKFAATGTVPVGALGPGDYVVRGIVTVAGQGSGRVLRTLHKVG